MRTLLLCPELYAHEGGIQRILRLYLRALCDQGDEVHLLVLNDDGFLGSDIERYADDRLVSRSACGGRRGRFIRAAIRAGRHVDRIVCGHVGQLPACWLAQRWNRRLDYYLVAHGIEVWRDLGSLTRRSLRRAAGVLCVSEYTRGQLMRRNTIPSERYSIVPNALDPYFATGSGPRGPRRRSEILTVSRLSSADRYKGVEHLILAMPAVREVLPDARLRIVGTGDDRSRLAKMASECAPDGAVVFSGFLDDDALAAAYAECSLFALPSQMEGFGIVYVEAMAHGTPCLGARAGAVPEVIDEASGILVEFGDVAGIASGVLSALRRRWDERRVRDRSMSFSYNAFRERLALALAR